MTIHLLAQYCPVVLAQDAVGGVATTVSSILSGRSDAMVILIGTMLLGGFWLWKIHLPRQESDRKLREADKAIHETNSQTLAELGKVTAGVHSTTVDSNKTLRAMIEVKHIEIDCLSAVSEFTKCDIREQLAEARGVLRAVAHGVTSND